MSPLTKNFVKQLVAASDQKMQVPLSPEELGELAKVWLTFQLVMQAIVQPKVMGESVQDLYAELAKSLTPQPAPDVRIALPSVK
jgi:hypothetical protein